MTGSTIVLGCGDALAIEWRTGAAGTRELAVTAEGRDLAVVTDEAEADAMLDLIASFPVAGVRRVLALGLVDGVRLAALGRAAWPAADGGDGGGTGPRRVISLAAARAGRR